MCRPTFDFLYLQNHIRKCFFVRLMTTHQVCHTTYKEEFKLTLCICVFVYLHNCTSGVPHDVQGGVQTDVQLPAVVQERPAAEVRLQEEVLHQVSRSLLSDQNFFYTFTSFLCLLTLDFRACLLFLFCWSQRVV